MIENKRFLLKLHQSEPCFYELLDNGESCHTSFGKWITLDDGGIGSFFVDLLNNLNDENESLNKSRDDLIAENRKIKATIKDMFINERTYIGKSVLKQLWEAIQ